jgi:hypothetical protein
MNNSLRFIEQETIDLMKITLRHNRDERTLLLSVWMIWCSEEDGNIDAAKFTFI